MTGAGDACVASTGALGLEGALGAINQDPNNGPAEQCSAGPLSVGSDEAASAYGQTRLYSTSSYRLRFFSALTWPSM